MSDRARSVPRDGLPTVSGRTRTRGVLGSLQLRARAEYSSLMRSASGDAERADAGFDDGRVGRTSVPWVAREYLADAGTNATRGNRAELSGVGASGLVFLVTAKKILRGERIQSHPRAELANIVEPKRARILSHRPCPVRDARFLQETHGAICV